MKNEFDKTIQRTRSYWYVDGLWEIGLGVFLALVGAFFLAQALVPPGSRSAALLEICFLITIIGSAITVNWAIRKVKESTTYPRTGYIAYRRQMDKRTLLVAGLIFIISVTLGSILFAVFTIWKPALDWLPILHGFFGFILLLPLAYSTNLRRLYALSAFSVLVGVALYFGGLNGRIMAAAYYGLMGVAIALSGVFTLRTYLQRTQVAAEDAR